MKTVLYNTYTGQVIFELANGYKDEEGIPLHIEPPVVELEVVEICPDFDPVTQKKYESIEVYLELKQYKHVWTVVDKTPFEIAMDSWHHPEFAKRIIAPVELVMQYPAVETWFRINDLPIVRVDSILNCYCNLILPAHQQLVDALSGIVTIEERPTE